MLHVELCKSSVLFNLESAFFSVFIVKAMDRSPDFCLCTCGNHGEMYIFGSFSYIFEDGRQQVFAFVQRRSRYREVACNQVRGQAHYQCDLIYNFNFMHCYTMFGNSLIVSS